VALLLNQGLPGQALLRALALPPFTIPGVVVAILWRFMYDPQLGLINALLLVVTAFVLPPFFWMISVSLKPAVEPFAIPARL
jgi:ABC-type sugar transport system permease subunit